MRNLQTSRSKLIELANPREPGLFTAHLAEDYDGIGQYVLVALAGSSVGAAYKARVAAGDFGGSRTIPRGTPVVVHSFRGNMEVFLGNQPGCKCPGWFIDCFDGQDLHIPISDPIRPIQLFPTKNWVLHSGPNGCTDAGIARGSFFADLQPLFGPPVDFSIKTEGFGDPVFSFLQDHRFYSGKFRFDRLPLHDTNSLYFLIDMLGPSLEIVVAHHPTDNTQGGFIRLNGNTLKFKNDWIARKWYLFEWELFPDNNISQVRVWLCGRSKPSEWDVVESPPNPASSASHIGLTVGRNFQLNPGGDSDIRAEVNWLAGKLA